MYKKIIAVLLSLVFVLSLFGCSESQQPTSDIADNSDKSDNPTTDESKTENVETAEKNEIATEYSEMFSDRDISGKYDGNIYNIKLDGNSAEVSGGATDNDGFISVTSPGTYILSGNYNGYIEVDVDGKNDKVQLVMSGCSVSCENSAAIYVKNADKVFITLADNTENTVETTGEFISIDDSNIDSVIFAKDDLTFNGNGRLTVKCENGHGIVCKNDLVITSGKYDVTASSHGISGKDSIGICGGEINVTSGKDGIHSENSDEADKGYIYISDGIFNIKSDGDAISATNTLTVDGGTFTFDCGDASTSVKHTESFNPFSSSKTTTSDTSAKGLKAEGILTVNGGNFTVDSEDDSIHSGSDLYINGGMFTLSAGDDGIHSDNNLYVNGGNINIDLCYEGLEGVTVNVSGGEVNLYATDDGINAAGGEVAASTNFSRGVMPGASESYVINISGGRLFINADGDGVDSNGYIYVTGGELYVAGPTDSMNGAIDYEYSAEISGGIVVAVGASGMAETFAASSSQCSIMTNVTSTNGTVSLKDSDGNVLIEYSPEKNYGNVVISIPEIKSDGTYILKTGNNETTITMNGTSYGEGSGFGGFGGGNFGGGNFGGGRNNGRNNNNNNNDNTGKQSDGDTRNNSTAPTIPDGTTIPEIPDGTTIPEMPDGMTFPEMPSDGSFPDMSNGNFPDMSNGNFPDMSNGNFPDMSNGNFPNNFGGGFPSDGNMPEIPSGDSTEGTSEENPVI